MKSKKIRWGISLTEVGLSLMFPTKREAAKAEKDLQKMEKLSKADVINYAKRNDITYGFQIPPSEKSEEHKDLVKQYHEILVNAIEKTYDSKEDIIALLEAMDEVKEEYRQVLDTWDLFN